MGNAWELFVAALGEKRGNKILNKLTNKKNNDERKQNKNTAKVRKE
jgi:hypothetical protein